MHQRIIFFDGYCHFCNGTVTLLLKLDKNQKFKFAPLSGITSKTLNVGELVDKEDSIVYFYDNKARIKSSAIFHILRQLLPILTPIIFTLELLPAPLWDKFYDYFARYRYRLFGKMDTCRIPTEKEREFFLD